MTARRLVEHRKEKGGFNSRAELKEVSGVGDATFVQVAGFLRISGGDSPMDSTSIHPESYPIAEEIIKRVNATTRELFPQEIRAASTQTAPAATAAKAAAEASPAVAPVAAETPTTEAVEPKTEVTPAEEVKSEVEVKAEATEATGAAVSYTH